MAAFGQSIPPLALRCLLLTLLPVPGTLGADIRIPVVRKSTTTPSASTSLGATSHSENISSQHSITITYPLPTETSTRGLQASIVQERLTSSTSRLQLCCNDTLSSRFYSLFTASTEVSQQSQSGLSSALLHNLQTSSPFFTVALLLQYQRPATRPAAADEAVSERSSISTKQGGTSSSTYNIASYTQVAAKELVSERSPISREQSGTSGRASHIAFDINSTGVILSASVLSIILLVVASTAVYVHTRKAKYSAVVPIKILP